MKNRKIKALLTALKIIIPSYLSLSLLGFSFDIRDWDVAIMVCWGFGMLNCYVISLTLNDGFFMANSSQNKKTDVQINNFEMTSFIQESGFDPDEHPRSPKQEVQFKCLQIFQEASYTEDCVINSQNANYSKERTILSMDNLNRLTTELGGKVNLFIKDQYNKQKQDAERRINE